MSTPKEFYNSFNLAHNPFRPNPIHEADPRMDVWIGYDKQKNQLWKNIERTRCDQVGISSLILLYGELGVGKSHALLWARYCITQKEKDSFKSCAYYIQTLKKDAGKVTFAGAFKEDIIGKSNIANDIMSYKQFLEFQIIEYMKENVLPPETPRDSVLRLLLPSSDLYNFAKDIIECKTVHEVVDYICPAKGKITDYQAMTTFTTLVNLFTYEFGHSEQQQFKKSVFLFVDEMDLLATLSSKDARETNDLIRHIYDNCPRCFCMILAFTASAAELNLLFADYVLSRVRKQIRLEFLEVDDAKKFVKELLDSVRVETPALSEFYPFEETAIEGIVSQIVSITPRLVITKMYQIIEELRLVGYDIQQGLVTYDFLEGEGIIDEVFGDS